MHDAVIYNKIASAIKLTYPLCYTAQKTEPVPESFPSVLIHRIGRVRQKQYATLDNGDVQTRDSWEVQVYSHTKDEADSIMDIVEAKFKSMSFFEELCQPVESKDPSLFRLVARFSRVICESDTL